MDGRRRVSEEGSRLRASHRVGQQKDADTQNRVTISMPTTSTAQLFHLYIFTLLAAGMSVSMGTMDQPLWTCALIHQVHFSFSSDFVCLFVLFSPIHSLLFSSFAFCLLDQPSYGGECCLCGLWRDHVKLQVDRLVHAQISVAVQVQLPYMAPGSLGRNKRHPGRHLVQERTLRTCPHVDSLQHH